MMDWNLIWKAILIIVIGIILVRFSGRKSISQMTISQTVLMISIGTLLIQPISNENIWVTFGLGAILILTLNGIEYLQMKWDVAENFFTGRAKVIVKNGQLNEKNLTKLRLTVDQLEIRLRQNGIEKISDLQWATLEPSGQLGYSLLEGKKPATKEDINKIQNTLNQLMMQLGQNISVVPPKANQSDTTVFSEIEYGHKKQPNDRLR